MATKSIAMFFLYIIIFSVAEIGFFVLARHCLDRQVTLDIFNESKYPEMAHIFTVVCILWQTIAAAAAERIITDSFSREWSVQQGEIIPGISDRVSTITSDVRSHVTHSLTGRASRSFKLAFPASLLLFVLIKLALGIISAADVFIDVLIQVEVGTLFVKATGDEYKEFLSNAKRVSNIIHLEQLENTPPGLKLQPNLLALYPTDKFQAFEYDSDVVEFHYSCHWEAPHFVNDSGTGLMVVAGGRNWSSLLIPGEGVVASSITPLSFANISILENIDTSAFLFIGGNSTFQSDRTNVASSFAIDLGTLPTAVLTGGIGIGVGLEVFVGPLASVLICDPRVDISGGRARLSQDGTLRIVAKGNPRFGNFPKSAANLIFTSALNYALAQFKSPSTKNLINDIGSALFMSSFPTEWDNATNIPPFDLPTINKKMDAFMLSAAKPFLDGHRSPPSSPSHTLTSGSQQQRRLVLATSRLFWISAIIVFSLTLALLIALVLVGGGHLFNLQGVLSVLQEKGMSPTNLEIPGVGQPHN